MRPNVDIVAEATGFTPRHRFDAGAGVEGCLWRQDRGRDLAFQGRMAPDTYVLSSCLKPIQCRSVVLDGRNRFSGTLEPGGWTILSSNAAPEAFLEPGFSVLHVYLSRARLLRTCTDLGIPIAFPDCGGFHFGPAAAKGLSRAAAAICEAAADEGPFRDATLDLALETALLEIGKLWHRPSRRAGRAEELTAAQVRRIDELILSQLDRPRTVEDMARALGYSRSHFARAFRNTTGNSPSQHDRSLRIDRALGLLRDTSMPVGEVAASVGFADPSHFARVFGRHVGRSPTAYRAGR